MANFYQRHTEHRIQLWLWTSLWLSQINLGLVGRFKFKPAVAKLLRNPRNAAGYWVSVVMGGE
jgi:hypothetical protein